MPSKVVDPYQLLIRARRSTEPKEQVDRPEMETLLVAKGTREVFFGEQPGGKYRLEVVYRGEVFVFVENEGTIQEMRGKR